MYRAVKARCRTCGVIALDVLDQRGVERFGRSFPCSTTRAASRLSWMFHIARLYRTSGIGRLYVYNWTGAGCAARFDAGLTAPNGTPRRGYDRLRAALPNYLR
jgi:hypothetical protein